MPEARGGLTTLDNLALCCRACNLAKYTRTEAVDPVSGVRVPLFHPRQQQWSEHFVLERVTGIIQGSTPTGRATVEALGLNAAHPLATRKLLLRIGLI
jgi:5-methylcytosine-specific restriction endonuclease McrA